MGSHQPKDYFASIQAAKSSSMTDDNPMKHDQITRTVLKLPSITGQPYVVFSGPILEMYSKFAHYIFEPSELQEASNLPEGHNTVFNIPTITDKAVVTTAKLIRIWDDCGTRYIVEQGEPELPEAEGKEKEPVTQSDSIRRVLEVLDKSELSDYVTATETYDLALKLIEAVRG